MFFPCSLPVRYTCLPEVIFLQRNKMKFYVILKTMKTNEKRYRSSNRITSPFELLFAALCPLHYLTPFFSSMKLPRFTAAHFLNDQQYYFFFYFQNDLIIIMDKKISEWMNDFKFGWLTLGQIKRNLKTRIRRAKRTGRIMIIAMEQVSQEKCWMEWMFG